MPETCPLAAVWDHASLAEYMHIMHLETANQTMTTKANQTAIIELEMEQLCSNHRGFWVLMWNHCALVLFICWALHRFFAKAEDWAVSTLKNVWTKKIRKHRNFPWLKWARPEFRIVRRQLTDESFDEFFIQLESDIRSAYFYRPQEVTDLMTRTVGVGMLAFHWRTEKFEKFYREFGDLVGRMASVRKSFADADAVVANSRRKRTTTDPESKPLIEADPSHEQAGPSREQADPSHKPANPSHEQVGSSRVEPFPWKGLLKPGGAQRTESSNSSKKFMDV